MWPGAFILTEGEAGAGEGTWRRARAGLAREPAPDVTHDCCLSALACFSLPPRLAGQDADQMSSRNYLIMFRSLHSEEIREVSDML